jgi:drug/metabolite transporter (DMT)-like permease
MNLSPQLKGILLAITGFSLFTWGDAIVKLLSQSYNVYSIVFFNVAAGVVVLFILSPWLGGIKPALKSPHRKWHLLRGLFLFAQQATIIYGFAHMSLAKAYSLIFTSPFYTTILALFLLKEAVRPGKWGAIIMGFCGVLIILRPGIIPLNTPALSVLLSALCFSFTNLLVKRFAQGEPLTALSLMPQSVACICALIVYLLHFEPLRIETLPLLMVLGILNAAGYLALSSSFLFAQASLVAPFHYIQIIWGAAFGYIFFGDAIDFWTGLGALVIVAGGLWLIQQGRREAHPVPAAVSF